MDQNDLKDFILLRQGAEARLYTGMFIGQKSIAKERFSKKYRHSQLDERLTKERLKGEIKSLMRCKLAGIRTPTIFFVDMNNGLFVMEYLDTALTCREYIDALLKKSSENLDENKKSLTCLSVKIGRILAVMHKNSVIHGDLTTSNMLIEQVIKYDFCVSVSSQKSCFMTTAKSLKCCIFNISRVPMNMTTIFVSSILD